MVGCLFGVREDFCFGPILIDLNAKGQAEKLWKYCNPCVLESAPAKMESKRGRNAEIERAQHSPLDAPACAYAMERQQTCVLWFEAMVTDCLLRLRFKAIFICCLSVATSFGVTAEPGRIVILAKGSAEHANAGLQELSGRNGSLYIPARHAESLPLLILLHKTGGSPSEWFARGGSYAPYADRAVSSFLRPNRQAQAAAPGQEIGATIIWRSIALWKKRLLMRDR